MKKDFWDYVFYEYVPKLCNEHIYKNGHYMAAVFPIGSDTDPTKWEKSKYDDKCEVISYFRPTLRPKPRKELDQWKCITASIGNKDIWGFICIMLDRVKHLIEHPNSQLYDRYTTHLEKIKHVVLHECRHCQQFGYLLELFDYDIDVIKTIYLEPYLHPTMKKLESFWEWDAHNYAFVNTKRINEKRYSIEAASEYAINEIWKKIKEGR